MDFALELAMDSHGNRFDYPKRLLRGSDILTFRLILLVLNAYALVQTMEWEARPDNIVIQWSYGHCLFIHIGGSHWLLRREFI